MRRSHAVGLLICLLLVETSFGHHIKQAAT
jgi:hypothetical protein